MALHRFRPLEKTLFVFPFLLVSFPLWRGIFLDDFDKNLRQLSGPKAIDLGRAVDKKEDWHDLERKCVAAFESKKPFYARYDSWFYSNDWSNDYCWAYQGIAGNEKGEIYFVYYFPTWAKPKIYKTSKISLSKPNFNRALGSVPVFEEPFPFDEPQTCPCK